MNSSFTGFAEKFDSASALAGEDDDLDFQPAETTYETTGRKSKKGVFGSRGRFGRSDGGSSWRKRNDFLSLSSRESLEQESGLMAEELSPEVLLSGLSEEDTYECTKHLNPKQVFSQGVKRRPLRRACSVREESTGSSRSLFHNQSSNAIPSAPPQQRLSRRLVQRSHSLQLGYESRSGMASLSSFQASAEFLFEENEDPNSNLNDIESTGEGQRDRKKQRGRRHSLMGNITVNACSLGRTSSSSTASSNLPVELGWLSRGEGSPSKSDDLTAFLHESTLARTSQQVATSPNAFSATSSRKRGVCDSPSSEQDEYCGEMLTLSSSSVSDSRRTRSRSCIYETDGLPSAPSLARAVFEDEDESQRHRNKREDYGGRGDAMEESSDDSSVQDSSPDSSFEAPTHAAVPSKVDCAVLPEDETGKKERVFDAMSSYDDLKFLICQLRKLTQQKSRPNFGEDNVFKIAPLVNWSSQRRALFLTWTKQHLGFTVRSVGMGYTYVQISKVRGQQLLKKLEEALVEHKKTALEGNDQEQPRPIETSSSSGVFTIIPSGAFKTSLDSFAPVDRPTSALKMTASPSYPDDTIMDDVDSGADDLVSKISNLNLLPSKEKQSLPRHVTILAEDDTEKEDKQRLSIASSTYSTSSSRPSIDSFAHATDFNLHNMLGHSPRIPSGRPPKMSIGSTCSASTAAPAQGRPSTTPFHEKSGAPCASVNFVRTPLMTQNRGWGSQPIAGRDWGKSIPYKATALAMLLQQFERLCGLENRESANSDQESLSSSQRSSTLALDFIANPVAQLCEENSESAILRKEARRKSLKRMNTYSKRKRMSLFVTATGAVAQLPRQRFSVLQPELHTELQVDVCDATIIGKSEKVVSTILSFMSGNELLTTGSLICTKWSDWATVVYADLLLRSVQDCNQDASVENEKKLALEKAWPKIHSTIPWACFLAEGGAKKVYKIFNSSLQSQEAISVMDTHEIESLQIVANELAVSAMLSSMVRRSICPNFIVMREVFTCAHPAPLSFWGHEDNKHPKGEVFVEGKSYAKPREPKSAEPGRFQYIRMELCNEGDAEELIKRQEDEALQANVALCMLFQVAFALYSAADKYSVKHYDVKLLNIFVQRVETNGEELITRIGLGSHVFALRMPPGQCYVAKLADFGTANILPATNGQPVAISHFTTLENTPPEYCLLGDDATQGHEHDWWNLGLCMLHLFTGHRPYEEIMEDVQCPPNLRSRLSAIWEDENVDGYSVIRSVILDGVDKDEYGHIIEGEPDHVFHDTLYRHLVLCGIPDEQFQQKTCPRVWKAISETLQNQAPKKGACLGRAGRKKNSDATLFTRDCKKFSLRTGNNKYIARARDSLQSISGGMDLLIGLLQFDPKKRFTAMHVLNSTCMECLRETDGTSACSYGNARVESYMSFATN